jgi:hypothetical protein
MLVDPGYLDPAQRRAEVILQNLEGVGCTDILSGVTLKIRDGKIVTTIPAGLFRIIDITHRKDL